MTVTIDPAQINDRLHELIYTGRATLDLEASNIIEDVWQTSLRNARVAFRQQRPPRGMDRIYAISRPTAIPADAAAAGSYPDTSQPYTRIRVTIPPLANLQAGTDEQLHAIRRLLDEQLRPQITRELERGR